MNTYTPELENQLIQYYRENTSQYFDKLKPFINYTDELKDVLLEKELDFCKSKQDNKPIRQDVRGKCYWYSDTIRKCPNGFIEKLTGLSIYWTDEPLQYIIEDKRTITDEEDKMLKKMARDLRKNNDY